MRILHVGDDFAAFRPCGLTLYSDGLMQGQVRAGHDVSYLFSGRHYPKLPRPRLKRWSDRGVRMFELIGSPIHSHWTRGTREPLRDLAEPVGETAFAAAMREAEPQIVHFHELAGLPSSLLERARESGAGTVMTLHDYRTLCASVRLLDADGSRCTRVEVGEDCARNCAGAPAGPAHLVEFTVDREVRRLTGRLGRLVPAVNSLGIDVVGPFRTAATRRAGTPGASVPAAGAPPADYQRRRDVNLARLAACDRLVAPSRRTAEVFAAAGVPEDRLRVQRLTLPHLERLIPRAGARVGSPLTFVALGGLASPSKGSRVVTDALRRLDRDARVGDYRLVVLGAVDPEVLAELGGSPKVELVGDYTPGQLDRLLDGADIGILPSVWEEVHGFVGIEMLAKGLPLIGNARGGIPEYVVDGETGWLNRSASGSELAALMAAAIGDPAEVARLQASVRARRAEIVRPMHEHLAEVEALYGELTPAAAIASPASRRAGQ